jgi:tRNA dimethylallyltransferase
MSNRNVFIIGCTGCGKGSLGREVARRGGAEIVSLDSMKVYRRMDVGTAKPSHDDRQAIPHHMIDVAEPSEDYSVAQFVEGAQRAMEGIRGRGKPVLVVGGTPLYLKAMTEGLFEGPSADPAIRARLYAEAADDGPPKIHRQLQQIDPVAAERIHPNDLRRTVRALEVHELTGSPISELQKQWDRQPPRDDLILIGLRRTKEDQARRMNQRVVRMMDAGLLDEVRALLAEPKPMSRSASQALGYAEIIEHLTGERSLAEACEMIKIHTRKFAKAQRTWFKRFVETHWIDLEPGSAVESIADQLMEMPEWPWSR